MILINMIFIFGFAVAKSKQVELVSLIPASIFLGFTKYIFIFRYSLSFHLLQAVKNVMKIAG